MASSLGSLVVNLGLDAAQFVDGLTKSEYQARSFVRNVTATTTRMAGAFAAVGVGAGAALAVLHRAAGAIAEYKDLADQVGASAEAVAGLQLAADLSGKSLDTVASASVRLTDALSKTGDESKGVGAALAAINVPLDEFKRLDPVAQLERVASALGDFEDGAGKTAVAVALFGRAGAELIPFLNDLAETGGRNVRLTQDQIDVADRFAKKIDRMKSEASSAAKVFVAELMPAADRVLDYVLDLGGGIDNLGDALKDLTRDSAIKEWGDDLADVAIRLLQFMTAAESTLDTLEKFAIFGGTLLRNASPLKWFSEQARKENADALAALRETAGINGANILALFEPLPRKPSAGNDIGGGGRRRLSFDPGGGSTARGKGGDAVLRDIEDQAARTREAVANLITNSEVVAAREYVLQVEYLDKLFFDLGLEAEVYDSAMKGLTRSTVTFGEDGRKALEEQASAWLDAIDPMREFKRNLEQLGRMLDAGIVTPEQAEALRKMFADATKEISEMDQFAIEAARNIQDHLGDTLYNALQGDFDDIAGSFKRMIDRMVAEAAAAQLAKHLMGDFGSTGQMGSGGTGQMGGILGSILQSGIGAFFGAGGIGYGSAGTAALTAMVPMPGGGFVPALAGGGAVEAGGLYRVNERRTEMLSINGKDFLMAGASGRVRPNPQFAAASQQPITVQMSVYANDVESFRRSETQVSLGMSTALARARRAH